MTEHEPERGEVAQPDATEVSADDLAGNEVEPEHDADPASFTDVSDDDDKGGADCG